MKPKLLILTDWFLPGYKAGGPIRSVANLCRELSDEMDLYVLTGDRDYGDDTPYEDIQPKTWVDWNGKVKVWYISPQELSLDKMLSIIEEVNPSMIYLNSMFSVKYAVWPVYLLAMNKLTAQLVWAPRGMLHKGAIQYKRWRKYIFLALVRLRGLPAKIRFHATDEQEALDIRKHLGKKAEAVVIGNLTHLPEERLDKKRKANEQLALGFISRIHPKKNLLFLLEVLQGISSFLKLNIWGPVEDENYWEKCQQTISQLPDNIQVAYEGVLTHEGVEQKLNEVDVFVLPTQGENFGHAIYEAFAQGTPALISEKTPWRNLSEGMAGWDLPLESEVWRRKLEELIHTSEEEFTLWQEGARAFAEQKSVNKALVKAYKNLFLLHA